MMKSFNEFKYFKSFRLPIEASDDVQFIVTHRDPDSDREEVIKEVKLIDISVTGLSFISKREFLIGEDLELSLHHKKMRLELSADIVRIIPENGQQQYFIYGLFISEEEDRQKMRRLISQVISYCTLERIKQCLKDLALGERYTQMNEGFEVLSLIISLFGDLNQYLKQETFFSGLLDEAARLVQATRAFIYLINVEKNELEAVMSSGHLLDQQKLSFDYRQGVMGKVFTTAQGINLEGDHEQLKSLQENYPFKLKSVLSVPIINSADQVVGVLQLENKRQDLRFSKEDEQVARIFSLAFSTHYSSYHPASEQSQVRRFSKPFSRDVLFIGKSESTSELRKTMTKLKDTHMPVLVMGEKGVGKSLYAKILHVEGNRSDKEFLSIYCQGIDRDQLEQKIFGTAAQIGAVQKCQGGSICFEEVDSLSYELQEKLWQVIRQSFVADPLSRVNVRFLFTSSNPHWNDLRQQAGKMFPELYDFISQYQVQIRPLREKKRDVADLVDYYLQRECKLHGLLPKVLSDEMKQKMVDYSWPGNVRELKNAISRLVLYYPKHHVITDFEENTAPIADQKMSNTILTDIPYVNDLTLELKDRVLLVEREMILAHIKKCKGNKSKAAQEMGISREALRKKMMASDEILERLGKVKKDEKIDQADDSQANIIELPIDESTVATKRDAA